MSTTRGELIAKTFLQDLQSGATVDRHVADQLVLFAAFARGVLVGRYGFAVRENWITEGGCAACGTHIDDVDMDGVNVGRSVG